MERICTRCGCTGFHYNSRRMRMECDACGHPVRDPQEDQQQLQFDRTYSLAADHLAAGNWEQAAGILRPLLNQRPTDRRLYLAILRAATRDFSDLDMYDADMKALASDAWNKLARLNGITESMISYARRRYERHQAVLLSRKKRILLWIFGGALCAILTAAFLGAGSGLAALIGVGGTVLCLYRAKCAGPVSVFRELSRGAPDYRSDPFVLY